jgi:hypothetical protein
MYNFKKFGNKLNEMVIYNNLDRFDNFLINIHNEKEFLKKLNSEIESIKLEIKSLDVITDIKFIDIYKNNENYQVKINKLDEFFYGLDKLLCEVEKHNNDLYQLIVEKYFNKDDEYSFIFHVEIERDNYNKFHFPVSMPEFLKNSGLGKKIIESAIKRFSYLLFSKMEDSMELKLSYESLIKRNNIFSFVKEYFVLMVDNNPEIVRNIVPKWKNGEDIIVDEDYEKIYEKI